MFQKVMPVNVVTNKLVGDAIIVILTTPKDTHVNVEINRQIGVARIVIEMRLKGMHVANVRTNRLIGIVRIAVLIFLKDMLAKNVTINKLTGTARTVIGTHQRAMHAKNAIIKRRIGTVKNVIGVALKDMLAKNAEENNDFSYRKVLFMIFLLTKKQCQKLSRKIMLHSMQHDKNIKLLYLYFIKMSFKNTYQFFYNQDDPRTAVMLKKVQFLKYLSSKTRNFPNFYFLNNPQIAKGYKATLQAMVSQKCKKVQSIKNFCNLAKVYYTDRAYQVQQFEKKYLKVEIDDPNIILHQYSQQTFFYRLLNSLLRGSRDPTQSFYAHYFVQNMHNAIRSIYKKQRVHEKFVCYRGAEISETQIEMLKANIGKNIQMLGFLSATMNQKIGKRFISNCFLIIQVNDEQKDLNANYGYVKMNSSSRSAYNEEEEILFNSLTSFQIQSVEQKQTDKQFLYYEVKLKYGITYNVLSNYKKHQIDSIQADQQYLPLLLSKYQSSSNEQWSALQYFPNLNPQLIQFTKKIISLWKNISIYSPFYKKRQRYIEFYENQLISMYSKCDQIRDQEISLPFQMQNGMGMRVQVEKDHARRMIINCYKCLNLANFKIQFRENQDALYYLQCFQQQYQILNQKAIGLDSYNMKLCKYLADFFNIHLDLELLPKDEQKHDQISLLLIKFQTLKREFVQNYNKYHSIYRYILTLQLLLTEMLTKQTNTNILFDLTKLKSQQQSNTYQYYQILQKKERKIKEYFDREKYEEGIDIIKEMVKEVRKIVGDNWNRQHQYFCLVVLYNRVQGLIRDKKQKSLHKLRIACQKIIQEEAPYFYKWYRNITQKLSRRYQQFSKQKIQQIKLKNSSQFDLLLEAIDQSLLIMQKNPKAWIKQFFDQLKQSIQVLDSQIQIQAILFLIDYLTAQAYKMLGHYEVAEQIIMKMQYKLKNKQYLVILYQLSNWENIQEIKKQTKMK